MSDNNTAFLIAAVVGGISLLQLDVDAGVHFITSMAPLEQAALLGLLFSLVFGASTLAVSATPLEAKAKGVVSKKSYPLAAIQAAESDKEKFMALFPLLKKELIDTMKADNELLDEAAEWVDRMIEYSVPGGKLNRGMTVVAVYRTLLGVQELTPYQVARASVLGWTIEFLQAFFLVADDVMDDSQTRRGQPCWYKNKEVGLIAINDSFLLESFVFQILRQHFDGELYGHLLELLLDVTQKTEIGQLYDLTSQSGTSNIDLNRFTTDRYRMIVKYKTAFYSFYLPVAMGMRLAGIQDVKAYDLAKSICVEMGEYFQIQDDYLDCFGDPDVIGKIGTDIQDNKCSWLVVQALAKCDKKQRTLLEQNYGKWDDKKVAKVKQLYKDMGLVAQFEAYEESFYKSIQAKFDQVTLMPRDVFDLLLQKIYKRSK